jgi:hypothetical protein
MVSSGRLKRIGWLLVILNTLAMAVIAVYFLFVLKFSVLGWLCYNNCFFSILIFLIGFSLNNKTVMSISIPFLIFSGVGGLMAFNWSGKEMITGQIMHILIILLFFYVVLENIKEKEWKQLIVGFMIGLMFLFFLLPLQRTYINNHAELAEKFNDPNFQRVNKEAGNILNFFK